LHTWISVEARVVKERGWLQCLEVVTNVLYIVTAVVARAALLLLLLQKRLRAKPAVTRGQGRPDALPTALLTGFTNKRARFATSRGAAAGLCKQ
jgi:hypothetical protein